MVPPPALRGYHPVTSGLREPKTAPWPLPVGLFWEKPANSLFAGTYQSVAELAACGPSMAPRPEDQHGVFPRRQRAESVRTCRNQQGVVYSFFVMPRAKTQRARKDEETSEVVVIRKYANRRLYDTTASQYVTLTRVAELVREGREVKVVDARTGRDLTKSVLLQIIFESEQEAALLPVSFLRKVIEASGEAAADSFRNLLQATMDLFCQMMEQFGGEWGQVTAGGLPMPLQWFDFMMHSMQEMSRVMVEGARPRASVRGDQTRHE